MLNKKIAAGTAYAFPPGLFRREQQHPVCGSRQPCTKARKISFTSNCPAKKKKKKNVDKRGIRTPAPCETRIHNQLAGRSLNLSLAP